MTSERVPNCVFCDLLIALSLIHSCLFCFPLLVALILRLPALGPCSSSECLLDFVLFEEFYRSGMRTIAVDSPADILPTHHIVSSALTLISTKNICRNGTFIL